MVKRIVVLVMMAVMSQTFTLCGVEFDLSFEAKCKTTEDGFVYYEDTKIGVCIISLPDSEEVVIPEYVDGKQVKQLGYKDVGIGYSQTYRVDGDKVKNLTVQHTFKHFAADFRNLEKMVFIDLPYCFLNREYIDLTIPDHAGTNYPINADVELRKSDRQLDLNEFKFQFINIPDYVKIIDSNVFDNLPDVTIRTSYDTKPEGWEDGWNGNCEVEWGIEIYLIR